MEAFSDAVNEEITAFNIWCSTKEAEIAQAQAGIGSPVIVSLLSLESDLRGIFSESMAAVLHILRTVLAQTTRSRDTDMEVWLLANLPTKVPPAAVTCVLLDTLFQSVQTYLSMADTTTSNALMRVFVKTAEPVWRMIGRWLQDGMPVRDPGGRWESHGDVALDEEFFIEDNEMTLLDAEFWADGYTLRGETDEDEGRPKTIPIFLMPAAGHVLGSGKAIGLLRALGIAPRPGDSANQPSWPPFKSVLACDTIDNGSSASPSHTLQTDTLIRVVYDELLPHCQATGAVIASVLVEDCGLWQHLSSIEDLFLMRRGDTISRFADVIFAKVSGSSYDERLPVSESSPRPDGQPATLERFSLPE
jgi:gamma-tubulin complex component 5